MSHRVVDPAEGYYNQRHFGVKPILFLYTLIRLGCLNLQAYNELRTMAGTDHYLKLHLWKLVRGIYYRPLFPLKPSSS
jgi:hypothetical protein